MGLIISRPTHFEYKHYHDLSLKLDKSYIETIVVSTFLSMNDEVRAYYRHHRKKLRDLSLVFPIDADRVVVLGLAMAIKSVTTSQPIPSSSWFIPYIMLEFEEGKPILIRVTSEMFLKHLSLTHFTTNKASCKKDFEAYIATAYLPTVKSLISLVSESTPDEKEYLKSQVRRAVNDIREGRMNELNHLFVIPSEKDAFSESQLQVLRETPQIACISKITPEDDHYTLYIAWDHEYKDFSPIMMSLENSKDIISFQNESSSFFTVSAAEELGSLIMLLSCKHKNDENVLDRCFSTYGVKLKPSTSSPETTTSAKPKVTCVTKRADVQKTLDELQDALRLIERLRSCYSVSYREVNIRRV